MKKPIHKFNGGNGATLCHECGTLISEGLTEDILCEKCGGSLEYKYTLIRERDGLKKQGKSVLWVEWDENGYFKEYHKDPDRGRSLVLDFSGGNFSWMTTGVSQMVERQDNYIKFTTRNSTYELFIND